ncbi:endonuclease VIII [Anaerosacchariphilus polymeriproducens]|uniref:Endonuclease VIII n=1 Tax=Anaerosacchariphilus polymeriproducens TaxID=1812858 RepID=A0A371AZ14_9FIRM|nr:endonuclease VIII [Anaerosacchariphilus polymeriproducens]RDU24720.1 endonuclease VIII [Anaerosacchariphilus polymeriproducens]
MLEIPESNTISKQLNQTIKGKKIKKVITNSSPHRFAFYFEDPENYHALLTDKTVDLSKAVGGLIEIVVQDAIILFGDGANIRYFEKGNSIPVKHQLYLEFHDQSSLICTIQMYGGIWVYKEGENDNPYYIAAKERTSPLSSEFNELYFLNLLENTKQKLSLKAFLATEQRVPGLGNGVLQDILFRAGMHPKRKLESLAEEEKSRLYKSVKTTLLEMTQNGGRDTEKDLFGKLGGYRSILSKNTLKSPCPICKGKIVKQNYLGGSIYYCPNCQPN